MLILEKKSINMADFNEILKWHLSNETQNFKLTPKQMKLELGTLTNNTYDTL